jgi:hypothetical protein
VCAQITEKSLANRAQIDPALNALFGKRSLYSYRAFAYHCCTGQRGTVLKHRKEFRVSQDAAFGAAVH